MRDRPALDLFLISWLVLFLELACIRWFPSHVMFLTFFTNTVLLACFVGMSIGCLVARRPERLIRQTPYLLALAVGAGVLTDLFSGVLAGVFAVGNQANPDVVFFGTEASAVIAPPFTIPIEVVGGLFFVLIAAVMVGPGQEMGRAFNRVPNRATAYSANLLGSLAGIGSFAAFAYLWLPPVVWFGLSAIMIGYLILRKDPNAQPARPGIAIPGPEVPLICLGLTVLLTLLTSGLFTGMYGRQTTWSPYYRVDYYPANRFIYTNLVSHQLMEPRDNPTVAPYALPYLFQRDLKKPDGSPAWPEFKRILIIGAGSGNDVARALRWAPPDARIDAVEIDPVIQSLGDAHHPDRPFQDKRVTVYLNDGRNFLREAQPETYDLVIFALIDSLVLQSGYSNLRLESYLFTLESFQDVRRVLKPTGVYAVYNFFRQGWLAARIRDQLRVAFDGVDPVVLTAPPRAEVTLDLFESGGFTMFFSGQPEVIDPLREAFAAPGFRLWGFDIPTRYWYPWLTGVGKDSAARFSPFPPSEPPPPSAEPYETELWNPETGRAIFDPETGLPKKRVIPPQWMGMQVATVEETDGAKMATDDWPFLYARNPTIPGLTWRGVVLMLVLSVGLWFAYGGARALRPEPWSGHGVTGPQGGAPPEWGLLLRSFFLGAGFMLVETKAVVQMALLFGGTWMVNSVVFAAILVMALAGNLYAGRIKPRRLEPYYVGLFAALGLGLAIPPGVFLGLEPTVQVLGVCALVFAPIAFAGVIFAASFHRTAQPDRMFGANVAGALIGGLAENSSVLLGFQLLLCVAVGFYLLSSLFGNREVAAGAAEKSV
jgi:SAM-dependent methyltransferase